MPFPNSESHAKELATQDGAKKRAISLIAQLKRKAGGDQVVIDRESCRSLVVLLERLASPSGAAGKESNTESELGRSLALDSEEDAAADDEAERQLEAYLGRTPLPDSVQRRLRKELRKCLFLGDEAGVGEQVDELFEDIESKHGGSILAEYKAAEATHDPQPDHFDC